MAILVLESVTPARCERSREWISLRLDGMLSTFEAALLDRHLRGCPSCDAFATAATAQTELLRTAPLAAPAPVAIPRRVPHPLRRSASGVAVGVAAAVVAAFTVSGLGSQKQSTAAARTAAAAGPMIVVVAAQSGPSPTSVEVPRLRVQPVSVADLPVHGKFNDPVSL